MNEKGMKIRLCLWIACLLGAVRVQAAGDEWLGRMQQAVQALGAYEVQFDLTASNDYAASGTCRVEGERYLIEMPGMRVFGDGKVRYEINDRTKEVVIDAVQEQSHNLLDNPVKAFDFVGEQYAVQLLAEQTELLKLRLTPRSDGMVSTIEVTLDKRTALPTAVIYGAEDVQISVHINHFRKHSGKLPAFRKADFPGYEWIDFR